MFIDLRQGSFNTRQRSFDMGQRSFDMRQRSHTWDNVHILETTFTYLRQHSHTWNIINYISMLISSFSFHSFDSIFSLYNNVVNFKIIIYLFILILTNFTNLSTNFSSRF